MSENGEADMSSSLKYETFGSLLINVVDNRGKTCPTADSGIPLIATNCVVNYSLYPIYEKVRYISEETYKTWFRDHPRPGDMIFVLKGTPGRVAWVPDPVDFCIAQDMVAIRADEGKIFPKYLFAVLRSDTIQKQIEGLHVGSLIPHFKKGDFDELKIPIVEPKLQEFIGNQYFDISLKIDLLHRQNKTLEALAQTLFRQWFVEEAEEGWETGKLGDYVECINGYSYNSSELNPSKNALVTLKSFDRNGGFSIEGFKEFTGKIKHNQVVHEGDLVVAHTDITQEAEVIGNPALVISDPKFENLVITMDLVKVVPIADWISKEFIYFLMRSREFKHHCLGCANGTTVLHLNKEAIPSFEFKIPQKEKIIGFSIKAKDLVQKRFTNHKQIRTLTRLRDTLLPKLMSGEVRVEYENN